MKKFSFILIWLVLIFSVANGQQQRTTIVVLGSSTAEGTGPVDKNNAWVNRYRAYLQHLDSNYRVINLAKGGYTTYQIMPSGFIPPAGRPQPDVERNVTKALALQPAAVIINLPSNDVTAGYTLKEQLANYDAVLAQLRAQNIPFWITTTQPRNLPDVQRKNLMAMRDSTLARFGSRAIDFWSGIADSLGRIKPIYDCGDGIHLNDHGHQILFERVVAASVHATLPKRLTISAVDRKIDSLLAIMTLEEKLGQLNQLSGNWNRDIRDEQKTLVQRGLIGSLLNVVGAEVTRKIQQIAVQESRLGIPLIFGLDVIHGFRTTFPIPLAEASTWDPAAVEQAARIAAIEATAAGIHWTFAPMVDIARDPRWGRIAEGSGEDPHLGAIMAAARVRGFQGSDLREATSLLACAKHFAAYGGAEAGRDYNTVDVSERTLREIYLPPFKAAVDAGVGSLMSSFNEISGIPSTANRWLLTDLLRNEWGFKGFVVSDWGAIQELQPHGVAATRTDAGMLALQAGVDMDMQSRIYQNEMIAVVQEKKISEEIVNHAVRRVLQTKFNLGLFDNPYRNCNPTLEKEILLSKQHVDFARHVAQKSIILLKNEKNLLPLSKQLKTIAVFGPLADDRDAPLGPWRAAGNKDDVVTVLQGIKNKVPASTKILYAKGCDITGNSTAGFAEAQRLAKQSDVVILVVGENAGMSGEAASRSNLDLPGVQEEFVQTIAALGKPTVMMLMNGRPLAISRLAERVPVILETWFLGVQHGNAVADILFGEANPSGRLPVTFPRSVGQVPIYYNHKNTGRPFAEKDRFTSKYLDIPNTPLYPFGYGLSYAKFEYGNLRLSANSIKMQDSLRVSVTVRNAGKMKGDEIVQLYVQDEYASVTRPVKELKDFRRIPLDAGEAKTVEFVLQPEQLAFYNQEMKLVVEPGSFKVMVGTNSTEVLEARFELVE
ncbi:MAG: beta-glucosidase BglX [candidate division KSB1 bacterium]|nr:beta-glucosidase BglX [candidate division KSB1 bacterium]MDZ7300974.1 beta-glucosidase BglX [candidate division KSB1 bacterium]MDZ7310348.1 beta-glucosidase BglX [candidate division KSB1 bacterium]